MNYWIVLIPLLNLEPIKGQIYITGHTFLKPLVCIPCGVPPCAVFAQWLICPLAKNKTKRGIFRKHTARPPFVLLLLLMNSTTFLLWCGNVWIPLHMSTFVFSLIFIKTGGYMGGKIPPLLAEEGHGEEAEKGLIIWSVLSGRNYWSRWLSHRLWGTSTVWFCDFWAVTHRSSVHAKGSELLSNLLSSCQIQLETAGD